MSMDAWEQAISELEKELTQTRAERLGWIDAAVRQPPDAWPRPCVAEQTYGLTPVLWHYQNGEWWAPGYNEPSTSKVKYWMEVYPLPDGTAPST